MIQRWLLVGAVMTFASCSKNEQDPQVFLPTIVNKDGVDLDARRATLCKPAEVELRENFITQRNFQLIFQCANYDNSLNDLAPLLQSPHFPEFIESVNLVLKSENTQDLKETLRQWFEAGPEGTNRLDRLLPVVAKVVKNASFQDFLPVFDHILRAGETVWNDLLPGLADIVYTERFPYNLEDALDAAQSFGSRSNTGEEDQDYAKSIKDFANFLQSKIDGKTASLYTLELLHEVGDVALPGTSLYEFLDHMLEKGTISAYFLDSSRVRGEVVDPKLNEAADPADVACPELNETPEQRQECAYQRLFKRPANGGDAPIVQLAEMLAELHRDHAELLPALAAWFAGNGPRVASSLSGYVIHAQLITNLGELNIAKFLQSFAKKNKIDPQTMVRAPEFREFLRQAFASEAFAKWAEASVSSLNALAYGERNAQYLEGSGLSARVVALYQSPELLDFASAIIPPEPIEDANPEKNTLSLDSAIKKFQNRHRREELPVEFEGKRQDIEKHLGDIWQGVVKELLGEDVVMNYAIQLAQTFFTQMANEFRDNNQSITEWYYSSPYGNPATTEMIVGYATGELGLMDKYYQHKAWLLGEFADEVFTNEDDKRAFQILIEQVPNMVLYVRSGMSRSGGDLTRAMARDTNGYLVKSYVNLIVNATRTGWIRKGARLVEAYQQRPGRRERAQSFVSDDIDDRRDVKKGVEALERITRSLIQPERKGDYSTSTLGRLVQPLSSIVGDERRDETERFLLTSANEILALTDQQINDFVRDLKVEKPDGTASERIETYRSVADVLRNPNFPTLVRQLSALFRERAVQPALNFFAAKIDDGSLPRALLFIRRVLGFGG